MKTKLFKPTGAIENNAARGAGLLQKFNKSKTFDITEKLAAGNELSLNEIKNLYVDLSNLEKSVDFLKKKSDGCPNDETVEFLCKGGSAALAWSRLILRKENILKSYTKEILDDDLNKEDVVKGLEKLPVTKAVNEELKQVTYVAMVPDHTDLHGDYTSEDEVRKAKEAFNKSAMKANLFHLTMTDTFEVAESYLAPVDFMLNDKFVKKGTWLISLQVHDDDVWSLIKSGDINGISIGALANVEVLEETKKDE